MVTIETSKSKIKVFMFTWVQHMLSPQPHTHWGRRWLTSNTCASSHWRGRESNGTPPTHPPAASGALWATAGCDSSGTQSLWNRLTDLHHLVFEPTSLEDLFRTTESYLLSSICFYGWKTCLAFICKATGEAPPPLMCSSPSWTESAICCRYFETIFFSYISMQ